MFINVANLISDVAAGERIHMFVCVLRGDFVVWRRGKDVCVWWAGRRGNVIGWERKVLLAC